MKTIITHNGTAHRDEFMAISLATVIWPIKEIIRTSNPENYKDNDDTIFIDIGGTHDGNKFFDHHQGNDVPCSFVLVLKKWFEAIDATNKFEDYLKYNKWVSILDSHDRFGPSSAAAILEIDVKKYFSMMSPIDLFLIKKFSEKEVITTEDVEFSILKFIGESLVTNIAEFIKNTEIEPIAHFKENKLFLLEFSCKSNPIIQDIIEEKNPPFAAVIGGRGDNQLWIRDKSINIDLSNAVFIHPNGGLAGFKNLNDLKKAIGI